MLQCPCIERTIPTSAGCAAPVTQQTFAISEMRDDIMKNTTNTFEGRDATRNPLHALLDQGQSLWLDHITRDLVRGGELQRLIDEDGLRGQTSNPTIFQEAIAAGTAYDDQIAELARAGHDARAIFEALAVTDIQDACD